MTQEEKQVLIRDLCTRAPYGVKVWRQGGNYVVSCIDIEKQSVYLKVDFEAIRGWWTDIEEVKSYLRPMSSMTEEERKEYESFIFTQHHEWDGHGTSTDYVETDDVEIYFTWLNKKGFDYRGLIPMGLALEAPEGMYSIKEK